MGIYKYVCVCVCAVALACSFAANFAHVNASL